MKGIFIHHICELSISDELGDYNGTVVNAVNFMEVVSIEFVHGISTEFMNALWLWPVCIDEG
jgi:hypothetical protein